MKNRPEVLLRVFPELLFAYQGRSLLITARDGTIAEGLQGLYEHDLRLLSRSRLLVHGRPPRLDALSAVDAYSTLGYYVAPPTADGADDRDALGLSIGERDRELVVRVARFVGRGLHEDLDVTNYSLGPARLELGWELAADFADLFEARGGRRQQEAPISTAWQPTPEGRAELRFDYQHPQLRRGVLIRARATGSIRAGPAPTPEWDGQRLVYRLELGPRESRCFCLTVAPVVEGEVHEPRYRCDAFGLAQSAADPERFWVAGATRLQTRNATVQQAWDRAVADLGALALGDGASLPELAVPAAGLPLYGCLFGRDALTATGQGLLVSPIPAEGAIRLVARHLGTKDDDFFDEQPGRVPQQVRDSPLARLGLTPWLHDYGDYAGPCAFLVLVASHHIVVGDPALTRQFLEPARRVLAWLDERADLDGDGFLEYQTRSPQGQKHQGWKDAGNAVIDQHGQQVDPPIAPAEIQAYWYAAKVLMAEVFLALGQPSRAFELLRQAGDLKRRFNERFWMPDERFIAFGLDARKRQIRSIASNAGHCLASGIVEPQYAPDVVRRLMAPDMFSGWGIRTLSAENPAYHPFKYHLGTVWPVENATMAYGMKRYGFAAESNALAKGIFEAATLFEHHRLPEAFGGYPRDARHPHPGIYPDACAPQAWSATAIIWLVQAMLDLWTYAPLNLVIVEPELPAWLPELTLRDFRVKDARVSIQFKRDQGGKTDYRVLKREGTVRVIRQPPPYAADVSPLTRLRELGGSLLSGL